MGRSEIDGFPYHIDNYEHYLGKPIGQSKWIGIDQERVNQFGRATSDMNLMHVDPEWAAANSPFGGPVAHGFLTLSLLSYLSWKADLQPDGVDYGINLGFERVRFLAPVMIGDEVRMRAHLVECKPRDANKWWFKTRITVETRETEKAVLSAMWLILFVRDETIGPVMRQAIERSLQT